MPTEPGRKKTGGRKAGTPNKLPHPLRLDLLATLHEHGFDPVFELIRVNKEAWKEYERASEIYDAIQEKRAEHDLVPLTETLAPTFLKIAQSSAGDIIQYVFPKRKAVDVGPDTMNLLNSLSQAFVALDSAQKKLNAPTDS